MGKFSETLDRKAEEIERPPLLPIGTYIARVSKQFAVADMSWTSKEGERVEAERIEFPCQVIGADEVDEYALEEYGNVAGAPFRVDFIREVEENANQANADFRIRMFLEACGALKEGMTLEEGLNNAVNCEFLVELGHRPDKNNPDVFYLEAKKTFALD